MPPLVAAAAVALGESLYMVEAGAYLIAYSSTIGYAVTIAGSIAYSSSQNAKARRALSAASADQGRSIMVRDPISPRRLIYGQVLVSGTIVFIHTTGTKNEYLHLVIMLAGHEVDEIGDIYFNDEIVPFDGVDNAATGKYAAVARCNKKRGVPGDTADHYLVAETGGVWTSAHTLSGCAYINVRLKWSTELFPNGLPTIRAMVKGKKLYDWRTGLTVWSDNAALCAADYLMDSVFGKGVALARVVAADVIEAANICDENVVLADASTEDRYTTNGTITSDQDPSEVLRDLAGAMAGHIVDTGGTWTVRAGAYRSSTVTLTDDDLVGSFSVLPRQSRQDTFNRVRGVFISPDNQWAPADFPAVSNSTYKANDGAIWLERDVQYNFTTSAATAQRLAKIELERGRQQITCSGLFALKAMQCMPGDVVALTRSRLGWTAKEFEVIDWSFKPTGDGENLGLAVALNVRETAAGVWDWADGEETEIDLSPNTTLPDPFTVGTPSGLTLTSSAATTLIQADGTVVPRILVAWSTPNNIHVEQGGVTRIEYKRTADSDWLIWGEPRGDVLADYLTDIKIGTAYDVRIQFQNNTGVRGSYASASITAAGDTSGPSAPTGLAAVVGTGKSVSLDWDDNTEPDFSEYGVYRNTTNNSATATKIAETRASRFVDVEVTIGTQYFYWLKAIDSSENASGFSSGVNATPSTVAAGSVDSTAPGTPSAASKTAQGTYLSGDGTVFAYLDISVPALPTLGKYQNLLYKKTSGGGDWLIAAQPTNTGAQTVRIDDLSPGVIYDVAVQAFTAFAIASAITVATSSPFTAPNKTAGPSAPASGSIGTGAPARKSGIEIMSGAVITWDQVTDTDFAYYEIKATQTDTDGATNYSWINGVIQTAERSMNVWSVSPMPFGYVRVRAVNTSSVASAWLRIGELSATAAVGAGLAALANIGTSAGTVAAGDDSRITGAAQKSANLSDVASAATALGNLGGAAKSANLSDLASASTARTNLGLGSIATEDVNSLDLTAGITYGGGNRISFHWDGTNVKVLVDGSNQGTIPNP